MKVMAYIVLLFMIIRMFSKNYDQNLYIISDLIVSFLSAIIVGYTASK